MISSRAQFGVYGAVVPLVLVVDLPRLRRHRHDPRRPGGQQDPARRHPRHRHRDLRRSDRSRGGAGFLANQVGYLGSLAGAIAVLIYLVIVIGKLAVNCLNAYGGSMTILTTVSALTGTAAFRPAVRAAYTSAFLLVSVLIAIFASADFLDNFKNFVLVLLMVFTPWSAINLTDYYLISRERVDIPALYDPSGRYGAWNVVALGSYFFGIAA